MVAHLDRVCYGYIVLPVVALHLFFNSNCSFSLVHICCLLSPRSWHGWTWRALDSSGTPGLPCFCSANGFHHNLQWNFLQHVLWNHTSSWCIDQSSSLHHLNSGNQHACGDVTSHASDCSLSNQFGQLGSQYRTFNSWI